MVDMIIEPSQLKRHPALEKILYQQFQNSFFQHSFIFDFAVFNKFLGKIPRGCNT